MTTSQQVINLNFFVSNNVQIQGLTKSLDPKLQARQQYLEQSTAVKSPSTLSTRSTSVVSPRAETQKVEQPDTISEGLHEMAGYGLLAFSFLMFSSFVFIVFGSYFIENTENAILDGMLQDTYYIYLLPLMAPVSVIMLYIHWLSIKFFRHT